MSRRDLDPETTSSPSRTQPGIAPALRRAAMALLTLLVAPGVPASEAPFDSTMFGGLRPRAIGPAVMSGRVAALDAVHVDDAEEGSGLVVYVGAASGGVWKSVDGGLVFEPVFDDSDLLQSVGALRIDPSDPETIWVGAGESWVRNSVSIGDGVYRSRDGGESWEHLGLAATERIARIVVDPSDSDVVYVCATGQLWSANPERGVYKTSDGGESWQLVLAVDENTGCSDLDVDPQDPRILYAGMWQFRRYPWSFESGGPGSGLYRTRDGGETWQELTEGLPEGDKGRIAVGVAPSRPNRVYAVVEAEKTALYRSDDLGGHWEEVNSSQTVAMRPFYFANVFVDPSDHDVVYKPGFLLGISQDGGKTFRDGGSMHPDLHALWIDPRNPRQLLVGTDGGVYHSYDRGRSFRHVQSLPLSQYYEVAADRDWPYNVYGGLQDNGTWMGPSRASGGITAAMWTNIGFGDGFHAYPDPGDPNTIYVEYQGGELLRVSRDTGEIREIKPYPGLDDPDYRCNWNTAMHLPERGGTLYAGCQFLFRTTDQGVSWQRISDDLTTDDPEKQQQASSGGLTIDNSTAENHTTIYTISESPLDPQVIWVGTDDGNVQVSRDGGDTWSDVTANLTRGAARPEGVPARTWVSHVEASPHAVGTVFASFDGHRLGDMRPYVLRSDDFGRSWRSLTSGPEPAAEAEAADDDSDAEQGDGSEKDSTDGGADAVPGGGDGEGDTEAAADGDAAPPQPRRAGWADGGIEGFVHVVKQDPVRPELLFVGSELGLYLSLDGGEHWARLEGNLPPVPVHDLDIHPTEHDLIVGTHGRGIYILDDLTPLRALGIEQLEEKLVPLPSRPQVQMLSAQTQFFTAAGEFVGESLGEVASLFYYQSRRHVFGDMRVEIYDQGGKKVATLPAGKRKGINRVDWPMRRRPPKLPPATNLARAMFGPRVPEGTYTARIVKGSDTFEQQIELVADPRSRHTREDRSIQQTLANQLYEVLDELTYTVDALLDLQSQIEAARRAADSAEPELPRRTERELDALQSELEELRGTLVSTSEAGQLSGEERLREQLGNVFGAVAGYDGRPTDSQLERSKVLSEQFQRARQLFVELASQERLARASEGLAQPLRLLDRETWQAANQEDAAEPSAAARRDLDRRSRLASGWALSLSARR